MLNTTSEYALRAVVSLARLPEEQVLVCQELAARCEVPVCYLSKILQLLRDAGVVEAVRGLHGGYRLRRAAADIYVGEIVGLFEGERVEPKCLLGESCFDADITLCAHSQFRKIRSAYMSFLETTTIEQIAHLQSEKGKE